MDTLLQLHSVVMSKHPFNALIHKELMYFSFIGRSLILRSFIEYPLLYKEKTFSK